MSKLGIVIHAHKYYLHIDLHIDVGLANNLNTKKFQQEFINKNTDATYICVQCTK